MKDLELPKKEEKIKNEIGITLIALIITIIVLLILAGVSISALSGDNGIITQAVNAKKLSEVSTEKEAIGIIVTLASVGDERNEYNIGTQLYDRTIENGNKWHIITKTEETKTYGTGWSYISQGTEIRDYGETKYNWVVNYNTGEIEELGDETTFREMYYGMNLAVKDGLVLNVDPINMENEESWGEGVTLYGVNEGDGYGYNGEEFRLDGVDDYIEVYTDIDVDKGFTFEFYGKSDSNEINMLAKTLKNTEGWAGRFRMRVIKGNYEGCFGSGDSGSNWKIDGNQKHWIRKTLSHSFNEDDGGYFTLTTNLENNTVSIYWNGEYIDSTVCNHNYLIAGQLTNSSIPFTIGLEIAGDVYTESYSKMSIYSTRLYNRVLSEEEIKENYEMTTEYREAK